MISGVTMSPTSGSTWANEAVNLGADTAYPYSSEDLLQSVGSVIQQSFGPNDSTYAARNALAAAIVSGGGNPINVIAYSGGAAAFSAAYAMLTSWQQSMIGQILYLSPGAATKLASNGNTSVVLGADTFDQLATFGTQVPIGVSITDSSCDHTDLGCLFAAAQSQLSAMQANGSCGNAEVFTRTNPSGLPGYGVYAPMAGPGKGGGGSGTFSMGPWQPYAFIPIDPTPIVTTSITFGPVN
jgi:hypothetical protein